MLHRELRHSSLHKVRRQCCRPLFGDKLKDPDKGLAFQQVYDPDSKRIINDDYLKVMDEVRTELAGMGLEVQVS